MFTAKKFSSLEKKLQYRRASSILADAEAAYLRGEAVDFDYISMIVNIALGEDRVSSPVLQDRDTARRLNDLKFCFMEKAGIQVADWDMKPVTDNFSRKRDELPISVYLDNLRSPFNVGSIFRTAESLGFSRVLLSGATPTPDHPRAKRSAMGTDSVMEWSVISPEELEGKAVFALETGGCPIQEFDFPDEGIMILGSEETGVSRTLLELAEKSLGTVSIPMAGVKNSINVGVAFGIAAYYWTAAIRSRNT